MVSKERQELAGALLALSEGLSAKAKNPGIDGYVPHNKQMLFHKSEAYIRLYIGGNRAGKTHGGVVEDIWWATGTHPYIETPPPPVRIRVVTVDFIHGLPEIMIPKFKALTKREDLKGGSWEKAWNNQERKLTFKNGSEIQFMSYEQDLEKFSGTSQHLIHFDEEPPEDIYKECAARVVDTDGRLFITMTPVEGMTWVFDSLYSKVKSAPDKIVLVEKTDTVGEVFESPAEEIRIIEVGMDENPYIIERARERLLRQLTVEERAARSKGTFVSAGGKVFKNFDRKTHVIPMISKPSEAFGMCYIYTSTDHGWNNPTAWLWHAVFPDGRVVTFNERYESEVTIKEHAEAVKEYERRERLQIYVRTGDPAMAQHSAITGTSILQEYAKAGLNIYTDSVPRDPQIGIAKMQQYFRLIGAETNEEGFMTIPGVPMWTITENCVNFIKELENLQWQSFESAKLRSKHNKQEVVKKKNDHAFDSAKYFATFLPELAPDLPKPDKVSPIGYNGMVRYDQALVRAQELREESQGINWETVETFN